MNCEYRYFSLPLRSPLHTASGTITTRDGILVKLADGTAGYGEATPLPGWTESTTECVSAIKGAMKKINSQNQINVINELENHPAARHALSLALLDKKAREHNIPLYRELDQPSTVVTTPVNATIGDGSRKDTVEKAKSAVSAGFTHLKIKVGSQSPETDIKRITAVDDATPPGITLRLDANEAWDYDTARKIRNQIRGIEVDYFEQPLPRNELANLAKLNAESMSIALDESLLTTSVKAILEQNAADALIIKPMVVGGVERARSIALDCIKAGVSPIITTTVDAVIARTAAVHLAASLPIRHPAGLATADFLHKDLGPDPAHITAGRISVPQTPGTGITVDVY